MMVLTVSRCTAAGACLLVSAEDVANERAAREGLVDLHAGAPGVREQGFHALPFQALHQDVGALARLAAVPVLPLRGALAGHGRLCRLPCGLQLHIHAWMLSSEVA